MSGIAAALLIVMFAFGGTELVAIAAAESDDPARNIKRIVREIVVRILVFYMGSVFVIVTVLPWNSSEVTDSPFGAVLATLRVPGVDLLRSEEHTSELQSRFAIVCRLLLDKKKHEGAAVGWSTDGA